MKKFRVTLNQYRNILLAFIEFNIHVGLKYAIVLVLMCKLIEQANLRYQIRDHMFDSVSD